MPRTNDPDDSDDGDEYDAEFDYDPDDPETYPQGLYADSSRALIPCPHCRAEIDEESEQCPKCLMYLSREESPAERKTPTWVVLMLLALIAALVMAFGG